MDQTKYTNSVRMGDGNSNSGNVVGSFNTINSMADKTAEIMRWLSPMEPQNRHHGVRSDRLEGVGNWLLETNEFREWRSGEGGADKAVLFCHGDPGVGKTFLNSLVMDRLYDRACEEEITVAGVYCDFREQQEQTTANVMGAILKQLVVKEGQIVESIRNEFQKAKDNCGGRRPQLHDQVGMLKSTIVKLPHVLICIDALDEFTSKHLPELFLSLRELIKEMPSIRVFLTGRTHVEEQINRFFTKAVVIPISPNTNDIERYVERKLETDIELHAMNNSLRADILRTIRGGIAESFLLVSLVIDAILAEPTIWDRRQKLKEMTADKGLGDAYGITLARIQAQSGSKPRLGLEALMWVSNAERPLQVRELCHALAVEVGSTDLDFEKVPVIKALLGYSLGLITLEKYSSTVRLVHYTLQEYLLNNPALFHSPHSMIAEVCLTYLNFRSIRDLSSTLDSVPSTTALLQYASCYWGSHARREMTENVNSLAIKVLDEFDQRISSQLLLVRYEEGRKWWETRFHSQDGPTGFSGLHGAAYFGIAETVAALLNMNKGDVNATDCTGTTALIWAVRRGHEEVVKILVGRDNVNPNTVDTRGWTPLFWAAANRRDDMVKILLERKDVNPDTADTEGSTPLIWAAASGRGDMVKILLERGGVNPDTVDASGRTPLSWAARNGHLGVVEMLLERKDVNPDTVDSSGRTPLLWAARNGHLGVLEMLLKRKDVNPDTVETTGWTPLIWAAANGRNDMVKILLERKDIKPDTADTEGWTPLIWAAANGRDDTVKILLEQKDVNPDTEDTEGRTTLIWAAANGRDDMVKILLGRKDVNPDTVDASGRTPLLWAARNGHLGVLEMLLERKDVNPDTVDTEGWTPLICAAANRRGDMVKILLERKDVSPDTADTEGWTPLIWAAANGRDDMVKILLERKDVNPNTADTEGRTPLSWAARNGHLGVVEVLLERKDVSPDTADIEGWTPLIWAASNGCGDVVKILLERKDVNPDTVDASGRAPLLWAARNGHPGVVKILLERKDVSPDTADIEGWTPLIWAAANGRGDMVKILLERKDVNPDTADTEGWTPLLWVATNGRDDMVKILLERKDVNPNTGDTEYGETSLSLATRNGHVAVVRLLLAREDLNPNPAETDDGRTPLMWAAEGGYDKVVEALLPRQDLDLLTADFQGKTALSLATSNQHSAVVKLLSQHKHSLTNSSDITETRRTPRQSC